MMADTSTNTAASATSKSGEQPSLIRELIDLMDRFDQRIASARRMRYLTAAAASETTTTTPTTAASEATSTSSFRRATTSSGRWFLGRTSSKEEVTAAIESGLQRPQRQQRRQRPQSKRTKPHSTRMTKMAPPEIIDFPDTDGCVEDLRRMAELCVIGENYITTVEKRTAAYEAEEAAEWKRMRDGLSTSFSPLVDEKPELDPDRTTKGRLFDVFFERGGLKKIVELLNGELFQRKYFDKEMRAKELEAAGLDSKGGDSMKKNGSHHSSCSEGSGGNSMPPTNDPILLPPIPIATQALQSVSILIQNCSRITSLYVILSNNYINELINLPLQLYEQAVQQKTSAARIFANPEYTELTTHFVTFLKSLAIRINAETLQFFLAFHTSTTNGADDDDTTTTTTVDFPLYERALAFCVPDQDSFVRTTALSICLNSLRLTTIDDEATTIPWESKLCLAEYACHPARVEQLIAPTFTRCALAWTAVEEQLREMDACGQQGSDISSSVSWNEKLQSQEHRTARSKWARGFREKIDNLMDELLLLDDIFKVGLTVLNEQLIERMLATFVYPLLLQPLVEYCNQLDASVDEDRFSFSDHPFGAIAVDLSDVQKSLIPLAGPAKAALLTLSFAFQYLSNRPLLRLMYTVLLHPLLPDTTKAPTVRGRLQVAATDPRTGTEYIRLDAATQDDDRTTYEFGTSSATTKNNYSSSQHRQDDSTEACTFVLAPALKEVLEFRNGGDLGMLARTRPNPYRKAFLRFLGVPQDMSDLRHLAVCTLDSALAAFNQGGQFRSAILYGSDLRLGRKEDDDVPADERNLESMEAYRDIDRDLGGSLQKSRPETSADSILKTNFVAEAVTAVCGAVATAHRIASDDWKFQYDEVAAHVILLLIDQNPRALSTAKSILENRLQQASVAMASIPSSGLMPMGGSTALIPGAPGINIEDYEEQMYEAFLNAVFFDRVHPNDRIPPLIEGFVSLKSAETPGPNGGLAVSVSRVNDLKENISRVVGFLTKEQDEVLTQAFSDLVDTRRASGSVLIQLDAFVRLLQESIHTLRGRKLSGIAIGENGTVESFDPMMCRSQDIYANVSLRFCSFLFIPPPYVGPELGSIVDLSTSLALFCVCEVSPALAHYFNDEGVESEGITWQSLCLTFQNDCLTFCRPVAPNEAKVIGFCDMERLSAEIDPSLPNATNAARRLGLVYSWFDTTPPPLFLFDTEPVHQDCDGDRTILSQIRPWGSRLDVWFENGDTVEQAYDIVTQQCFRAKRVRGQRAQQFLDPNKEQLRSSSTFW